MLSTGTDRYKIITIITLQGDVQETLDTLHAQHSEF